MATRIASPGRRVAAKTSQRPAIAKRPAAAPAKVPPVASGGKAADETAKPKHKLVRDSFTIPKNEYTVLTELKLRAARLGRPAKKGEILRAGIGALHAMPDAAFLSALDSVPSLKTGRPKQVKTTAGNPASKKT